VAKRSLHMDGKAIDVRLPGVPLADLRDAALSLGMGGVGFYPREQFVHVDTGPVRRWKIRRNPVLPLKGLSILADPSMLERCAIMTRNGDCTVITGARPCHAGRARAAEAAQ
jgi:hypothetical protein